MNSKVIISVILSVFIWIPTFLSAQTKGKWEIGLKCQPFLYWKYNKADWNYTDDAYPKKLDKFNGWALGLSFERLLNDRLGLSTELTYSKQRQDFMTSSLNKIFDAEKPPTYYYIKGGTTTLNYLKIPIYATFLSEIGYESGLFLKLMGGVQVTYNTNYKSQYLQFAIDPIKNVYLQDSVINTIIITPHSFSQEYKFSETDFGKSQIETEYLYKRLELGILAGVSFMKKINDVLNISIGVRYEFGLTNIENVKNKTNITYIYGGGSGYVGSDRPATHNRRLVLDIGVSRVLK
jgi:hypothetical protein